MIALDSQFAVPDTKPGAAQETTGRDHRSTAVVTQALLKGKRPARDAASNQGTAATADRLAATADRVLVDRCIAGESHAWHELYRQFQTPLVLAIRILLGRSATHHDLVDDIAQKVWCTVFDRRGDLLGRFDAERGCRLSTFLAGLAKNEISRHFRAEWRRNRRELQALRVRSVEGAESHSGGVGSLASAMSEFLATLTPRERNYCEQCLLDANASLRQAYSDANRWQLHRRVRLKLGAFLKNDD